MQKQRLAELLPADSLRPAERLEEEEENSWIATVMSASKLGKKLDDNLQHTPVISRVWSLLKRWGHGNRTLHIIAILPLLAVGTYWSFQNRWRLKKRPEQVRFNLMEHFFIQAYATAQFTLVGILLLPLGLADSDSDVFALPWSLIFLLFWWDMRQLYLCTWWDSFKRSALALFFSLLLLLAAALVLALALAVAEGLL